MKKYRLLVVISLFLNCIVGYSQTHVLTNYELLGQTAPNDMIFVEGNTTMPSFYIGAREETNVNYIIYLKWLVMAYGSHHPNVVINALPRNPNDTNKIYLAEYFLNPQYANFPVVNISWRQIQDYMAWKTDRLNEMILIKTNRLKFCPQYEHDVFNTEAYLNMQCCAEFEISEDRVSANSGVLFTAYRLPTESEWEYANKKIEKMVKNTNSKNEYFNKVDNAYFLYPWLKVLNKNTLKPYENTPASQMFYYKLMKDVISYNIDSCNSDFEKSDSLKAIVSNYISNQKKLQGMDDGVKEWVLDKYSTSKDSTMDWLSVMRKGGFETKTNVLYDLDKEYVEKDSYGKMCDFRYIGVNASGHFITVSHQPTWCDSLRVVKGGDWKNNGVGRMPFVDTRSAGNIGFRCVLQYNGTPVIKGSKVDWNSAELNKIILNKQFEERKYLTPITSEQYDKLNKINKVKMDSLKAKEDLEMKKYNEYINSEVDKIVKKKIGKKLMEKL